MNGMGSVQISDSRSSGPEAAGSMNDHACGESQIPGGLGHGNFYYLMIDTPTPAHPD